MIAGHTYTREMEAGEDRLLRIGEAAGRIGVSVATIRRWDKDGLITVVRSPGGQRWIPEAECQRIIAGRAA